MKFRFYAVLHNMKLDNIKTKGKRINLDEYRARITNSSGEFKKILQNPETNERIGFHSANEFLADNTTYVYIDGELENIISFEEMNTIGLGFSFSLLRKIQYLTHYLWTVKDNNIYVRDGFLIVYENNFRDVGTYKASVSAINSTADNFRDVISTFSDEELNRAVSTMEENLFDPDSEENNDNKRELIESKYPTPEVFYESEGSNRYIRAFFFTIAARSQGILSLKIVFYINALECLFSISRNKITHNVAERAASLVKNTIIERDELYKKIKKAYNVRSRIVHGDPLNNNEDELAEMSKVLDNLLRNILLEHKNFFEEDTEKKLADKFEQLVSQEL
ncbi:hypothetical protein ACEN33_10915 [Ruoffia sp. FAM 24228]|uniref:hypothetical protein n=1 Tax=unclassified Ruoffia TaxID=2862149 RepID=UPI00388555AD